MFRKTIYIFLLFLLVASCAGSFDSVKRGLTGSKADNADEFLVKKKDPLILPPDFDKHYSKIITKTSLKLAKVIGPIIKNFSKTSKNL